MKCLVGLLLITVSAAGLHAATEGEQPPARIGRVLYLHGNVSEDGDVPSGENPPFHQMLLDDTGPRGMSGFREAIEAMGFEIEQAHDADLILSGEFLAPWNVLILGSNQRRFSKGEAEAVRRWVENGGGLVAWSDSAFGGHYSKVGLDNPMGRDSDNDLTEQFGMHFLTDNGGGNYLIAEYEEAHFLNAQNPQGGVRYRGEGVSPVRVQPPARLLAKLQEGGLGGKIKVNKIDEPFSPATDAALAVALAGKGRVVGTFDRNTFWNAGEGTRLSHEGNREFAQRLVLWAAGREDLNPGSRVNHASGGGFRVSAGKNRPARVGEPVELRGKIEGAGHPEVLWRIVSGPADAADFENNNAAALETRITFRKPGTYVLALEATDGHKTDRSEITVTVD